MEIQKTVLVKPKELKKKWILIDAKGKTLGRLATIISKKLQGKDKPNYTPYWDNGDNVIVINTKHIVLTGNKRNDKMYYYHTGYAGGIKGRNYEDMLKRNFRLPLQKAVKGMLPKNRISRDFLRHLKIYPEANHPHQAQNPEKLDV